VVEDGTGRQAKARDIKTNEAIHAATAVTGHDNALNYLK